MINSGKFAAPRFRCTPCVKSGPFGFVSGMVALDPVSGALVEGGVSDLPLGALVEIGFCFYQC
mgnify:FL=1